MKYENFVNKEFEIIFHKKIMLCIHTAYIALFLSRLTWSLTPHSPAGIFATQI